MARWHSCNILQTAPDANRLWQFDAKERRVEPRARGARRPAVAFGGRQILDFVVATQIERRVAAAGKCFPARHRTAQEQLRRNARDGGAAVGKTFAGARHANRLDAAQVLPQPPAENLQTIIVVIVERNVVEEFLGKLESAGFSRRPARSADARPVGGDAGDG